MTLCEYLWGKQFQNNWGKASWTDHMGDPSWLRIPEWSDAVTKNKQDRSGVMLPAYVMYFITIGNSVWKTAKRMMDLDTDF